jgi:hypothetical protein
LKAGWQHSCRATPLKAGWQRHWLVDNTLQGHAFEGWLTMRSSGTHWGMTGDLDAGNLSKTKRQLSYDRSTHIWAEAWKKAYNPTGELPW